MILAFADCELDAGRWELVRRGKRVEIQPKALGLLLYLARNRERAVSREELLEKLWPDAVVSDDALSHALKKARQAVGDDGESQRVIQTVRRVGFRFVAPLEERERSEGTPAKRTPTADISPPKAQAAPGTAPLVGRDAEFGRAVAVFDEAIAGHGQVLLFVGEAGIGKSRLTQAVVEHAHARGADARRGLAYERLRAPAFWPWIQILEGLIEDWSSAELEQALGSGAAHLAQIVPELAEKLPQLAPLPKLDAEAGRFRIFRAVTRLLTEAASRRPLVLVLEDLQWADAATLRLLEMLVGGVSSSPLLLIGTYRDEDVGAEHPLKETLAELERHGVGETVHLEGFSRAESRRYLEAELGFAPAPTLADAIHERTRGNPFFVAQLTRCLEAEGHMNPGGEPPSRTEAEAWVKELPEGVRNVLGRRLTRLGKGTRLLLVMASLTRDEFDVRLLEHVSRLPHAMLLDHLDEAAGARLIEEVPGAVGHYRFVHALVRSAVGAELSAVRRAELHGAIGKALEEIFETNSDPHLGELAHHFLSALPEGDPQRALDYAERAGRAAHVRAAYEEAEDFLGRALEVQRQLAESDPVRRYDLLMARAQALIGHGARARAAESYREAVDVARALGDGGRLAYAALGLGAPPEVVPEAGAASALEDALAALGAQESSLRCMVMARLSAFLATDPGSHDRAKQLEKDALELARRLGDAEARELALMTRVLNHRLWGLPNPEERLEVAVELTALAETVGNPVRITYSHFLRTHQLLELGDFAAADAEHAVFAGLAARWRLRSFQVDSLLYRSTRQLLAGRVDEAEALGLEALGEGAALGSPYISPLFAALLYRVRREQGRLAELETIMRAAAGFVPQLALPRALMTWMSDRQGHREQAEQEFEELAADDFAILDHSESWRAAAAILSEVCGRLGNTQHAAALYRRLEPHEPYWCFIGGLGVCVGSIALHLGILASTRSEWGLAHSHLEAATLRAEALGAPVWAARARLAHARMLLTRGRKADRRLARERLQSAYATARELDLPGLLAEISEVGPATEPRIPTAS